MTPKEYLSQINILNTKINHKINEIQQLKSDAATISSIELKTDKVKGGGCAGDARFVNTIAKIDEMEREVNAEIAEMSELRHKIINEIHMVQNVMYAELLYKKYIEDKGLNEIADEMHFHYDYIKHCHGYALLEFGKLMKESTQKHL